MRPNNLIPKKSLWLLYRSYFQLKQILTRPYKIFTDISTMKKRIKDQFQQNLPSINYYKNINLQCQIYNLQQKKSLCEWDIFSDQQIGGTSNGQLYYQKNQQDKDGCIRIIGNIGTQNRKIITQIPYFGISLYSASKFKIGPFPYLQVTIKSDGKPIHIEIDVATPLWGPQRAMGKIVSKNTDWQTYELPFINMVIISVAKGQYSMKTLIQDQLPNFGQLNILNFSIKLVGSQPTQRDIKIKNIKIARRKGYNRFIYQYKSPYFYIVKPTLDTNEDYYDNLKQLDTGDRVYIRQ